MKNIANSAVNMSHPEVLEEMLDIEEEIMCIEAAILAVEDSMERYSADRLKPYDVVFEIAPKKLALIEKIRDEVNLSTLEFRMNFQEAMFDDQVDELRAKVETMNFAVQDYCKKFNARVDELRKS